MYSSERHEILSTTVSAAVATVWEEVTSAMIEPMDEPISGVEQAYAFLTVRLRRLGRTCLMLQEYRK